MRTTVISKYLTTKTKHLLSQWNLYEAAYRGVKWEEVEWDEVGVEWRKE